MIVNFSGALDDLKAGAALTRLSWHGPDQWVVYQPGYPDGVAINANTARATGIDEGTVCLFRPYLMLRTSDGSFVPWVPTMSDLLASDWRVCAKPVGTMRS